MQTHSSFFFVHRWMVRINSFLALGLALTFGVDTFFYSTKNRGFAMFSVGFSLLFLFFAYTYRSLAKSFDTVIDHFQRNTLPTTPVVILSKHLIVFHLVFLLGMVLLWIALLLRMMDGYTIFG